MPLHLVMVISLNALFLTDQNKAPPPAKQPPVDMSEATPKAMAPSTATHLGGWCSVKR